MSWFSWCLQPSWPSKKVETLGPVAELQLVIVKARDLHSHELSKMFQPSCNPACKATSIFKISGVWKWVLLWYTLQMAIWNGIMRRVNGISDILFKWLFYIFLYHFMGYTENNQLELRQLGLVWKCWIPQVMAIFMGKMITNRWIGVYMIFGEHLPLQSSNFMAWYETKG